MDKDLTKGTPLPHDEKGQLQGGFQLQSSSFESHFFSDNGNCKGDGWFDDNVNCSRCSSCDKHKGMETVSDQYEGGN